MPRARLGALTTTLALLALAGCGGGAAQVVVPARGPGSTVVQASPQALQAENGPLAETAPPLPLAVRLSDVSDPVVANFKHPPRAGLLFDLDTGRVLWRRNPLRLLPIASTTKMMTALLVAQRVPQGSKVMITNEARAEPGQRIGVLPKHKRVGVSALLNGLLLVSGNDAAVALAQRVSGSVPAFVRLMNRTAQQMHLGCTQFFSPDGLDDRGHSCAQDLAALARAVLDQPRLAAIVRRPSVELPFPIKGGKLFLAGHNPLILAHYRGAIGVKTGFTDAAGRCLVGAAERGGRRLGVILLHSPDPGLQGAQLLNRGWKVH